MISAFVPFRDWSRDRLETCLGYLRALAPITEIILVDFGSAEPLGDVPGCRVVRVEADRWCLSEANNIGIAEATNPVVMKIDADVHLLVEAETLEGLAKTLLAGEAAFYVLQPTDFDFENGVMCRKRLRPEWAEGCCNLFSRDAVREIGGFDTRYFDYGGEDNDLCQRLRRYGKRVDYVVTDKVLHERHPPSASRLQGRFTPGQKKKLLAEATIFRPNPFRYSDYRAPEVFGPTITVAIATTDRPNRDAHLAFCLEGLARQTFRDFEVRICENGSAPEARLDVDALRTAFPGLDIHLHTLEEPSIPRARNLISDHARGFYIAVHDDDDVSVPTRFEEQLECLAEHDGAHGCHSSWIEFDEETGRLTSYLGQVRHIDHLLRKQGKVTLHGTGFYRRDMLARVRYDDSLTLSSDHHLHIRMSLAGVEVPHTGKFHYLRRLHASSVSSLGAATQRDVSDRTNAAYKYFLGDPFLSKVRKDKDQDLWVTGFPTTREMLALLPKDFGAFRIDLDLEAALALGCDPVFGDDVQRAGGLDFRPAFRGYGGATRLVMRSVEALPAAAAADALPAFREVRGVDVVAQSELAPPPRPIGLAALKVDPGHRRVISRPFADMAEALRTLPPALLKLGEIGFFAVNDPAEGLHVLLGTFDTPADLDYALGIANDGGPGAFFAVANKGKRGGFSGA